ncbi:MAG: SIS domain-containing protein [Bacteroidales bacterium]|nr:SIS domain-containing protein [Bacteroidales bacterium]
MKTFEELFRSTKNIGEFASGYFTRLKSVLDTLDLNSIERVADEFEEARNKGNTIFVIGNGGSATTASSMANDIGFDVVKKSGTTVPFKVLALTDNNSVITAMANDVGYDNIFLNQLKIHYREGDKILVISASGNSENVVRAAKYVKDKGGRVIGFLGFGGGQLKDISDVVVLAKTEVGEYGPVEDIHLIVNHVLAHWFQIKLRKNSTVMVEANGVGMNS